MARRRLAGLLLGLTAAVALVVAAELRLRRDEAGFTWTGDARRFAVRPGTAGTNAQGFHDRAWGGKRARRLVVLGDSIAWGTGGVDETFPRLAEPRLPGWEVLNAAHYGYDIAQVRGTLAALAPTLAPDRVVWAAYVNDPVPTRFVEVGGDPVRVDAPSLPWRASALFRRLDGAWAARGHVDTPDWAFLRRELAALAADTRALGADLLVFGLVPHVLAGGDGPDCDTRLGGSCASALDVHRRLHAEAAALGLPVASTLPALRATGAHAFYGPDATDPQHYGREGHVVLADALVDTLERLDAHAPLPGPD